MFTTWNFTVTVPLFATGSGDVSSCDATRSMHSVQVPVVVIVVVCVFWLLPSFVSVKAFAGSIVAVSDTDGGSPDRSVMKLTVIVVLPPPGRSPTQSTLFEAGAPQVKPFEPAAPTNVTPAVGRSSWIWTPVAVAVPPFTATTVYFNPCPGATGSGLSVIVEIARSKPVDPIADTTVESLLMRCTTVSSSHCVGSLQAVVSTSAGAAAAVFAIG